MLRSASNTIAAWSALPHETLVECCYNLEAERDRARAERDAAELYGVRKAIGAIYCRGVGLEVGAGDRPFPAASDAQVLYGDTRDHAGLCAYFGNEPPAADQVIDAETLINVRPRSLDFVISAHVIEHLFNPLRSFEAASRVLKSGGSAVIIAPEMTMTFDCDRPETSLDHVRQDYHDGGLCTRLDAYRDHVRYIHPRFAEAIDPDEVEQHALAIADARMDIHVHAWTAAGFLKMAEEACSRWCMKIDFTVSVANENAIVLRKI